jgi:DNA-binding NtrC family response regulator
VNALKSGAFDYVTKPFDQDELLNIVQKAINTYELGRLEPSSMGAPAQSQGLGSFMHLGDSPQMAEVARIVGKIAATPSTVLITGESGTGKELVASAIHRLSDRAAKPFIRINCAAIPHTLIESELFGYEKGAFTGAVNSKPGRFELAHEGTIFLDEVAEMTLEMQVKLLRVLQESEFERVGGLNTIKVSVRIIAATNKDLQKEVKEGRFREDLYYRLNVVPIQLPPLRERRGDTQPLIQFFLKKFNEKHSKAVSVVEPDCLKRLTEFYWPGNIRQLENAVEHGVLMADGDALRMQDLPRELGVLIGDVGSGGDETAGSAVEAHEEAIAALEGGESFKDIVKRQTQALERELIAKALAENDGNVTKTAEQLGLSRKGLQLKMKELAIRNE